MQDSYLVKVIADAAPTAGRVAVEETLEKLANREPPFDCMCVTASPLSWQPKQVEAIGELTRLSLL
jgi:hypothetical protein